MAAKWETIRDVRRVVTGALEVQRTAKVIGASLEAAPEVFVSPEMMALLVAKNPNALAGAYEILQGADAEVSMRIKMGETSEVVALVKADGKFYLARKEVKVTAGGCGG